MSLLDWFYGVLASLGLWQKEATILFLGFENSRKYEILLMLKDQGLVQHMPTRTSAELSIGKIKFKAFDLGGHQIVHMVLRDSSMKVDAVVYVVNVPEVWKMELAEVYKKNCLAEVKMELRALLSDESLANVPFLILGNMTNLFDDYPKKINRRNLIAKFYPTRKLFLSHLGLTGITTGQGTVNLAESNVRPLEVFMCDMVLKMGYVDAFDWLSHYIK